jgi:hypothetical protein
MALEEITGENPAADAQPGVFGDIRGRWLDWGVQQGMIHTTFPQVRTIEEQITTRAAAVMDQEYSPDSPDEIQTPIGLRAARLDAHTRYRQQDGRDVAERVMHYLLYDPSRKEVSVMETESPVWKSINYRVLSKKGYEVNTAEGGYRLVGIRDRQSEQAL